MSERSGCPCGCQGTLIERMGGGVFLSSHNKIHDTHRLHEVDLAIISKFQYKHEATTYESFFDQCRVHALYLRGGCIEFRNRNLIALIGI
jgi:hypothetical protein